MKTAANVWSSASVSLSISHTPWRPERVTSLVRLMTAIDPWDGPGGARLMIDRAPNHVWSQRMWLDAVETGADYSLFLQDDAQVAPRLRAWLDAMIAAVPGEVICFEAVHPAIPFLAKKGARWCTTRDGLVGVGYMLPTVELEKFLRWRETDLVAGAVERVNEDTLLGLWCLVTGRKVWHPIPTPLDHDVSLPSVFGNDKHPLRRPLVRWDTFSPITTDLEICETPGFWSASDVVDLGIFPRWRLPLLARKEVLGYSDAQFAADMHDTGTLALAGQLAGTPTCWFCMARPGVIASFLTGISLCSECVAESAASAILGRGFAR